MALVGASVLRTAAARAGGAGSKFRSLPAPSAAPRSAAVACWTPTTPVRWHGHSEVRADAATVTVIFVDKAGREMPCVAKEGQSLLEVAHAHEVDLEGACEASLACSTCHVVLPDGVFDALGEPSEEEDDMLDLAFGLTETSRLGCQVFVDASMDGMRVQLPEATRNFYVDGHVPKPH